MYLSTRWPVRLKRSISKRKMYFEFERAPCHCLDVETSRLARYGRPGGVFIPAADDALNLESHSCRSPGVPVGIVAPAVLGGPYVFREDYSPTSS
jgi:hypothetical protein